MTKSTYPPVDRRSFLKTSAATAAGAALVSAVPLASNVHAAGGDVIRVGLIGCGSPRGGRGRGAAEQCLHAGANVKLVAMGDLFKDHLEYTRTYLKEHYADKMDVPAERCYDGFDAYKKVLEAGVDLVILASPPGFRPIHIQAAVDAGKHIFAEKPIAVDAPGVRAVMKACEEAKKKHLSIVSGLCWRYDDGMRPMFQRIHDGQIGDLTAIQCTYNTGQLWSIPRKKEMSDMEWQVRDWMYFTWLSGDHIVEQHIHSLDKGAWAMKDQYPVKAVGLGGRQSRTAAEFGHIFDHHSVVFEYANGVKLFSSCRQQNDCAKDVSDHFYGTKGVCWWDDNKHVIKGEKPWKLSRKDVKTDMYQNEHNELIASIRNGKPINNGDYMCKSSLMAIMGRMATYTGQLITWDMALNSSEDLSPKDYKMGPLALPEVARPGYTKFV